MLLQVPAALGQLHAKTSVIANAKPLQAVCTRGELLQAVIWPQSREVEVEVAAAGAGCWNATVQAPATTGVIVQIRAEPAGHYVISASAPGAEMPFALQVRVGGLRRLHGAGCAVAGDGMLATLQLLPSGATATANCSAVA